MTDPITDDEASAPDSGSRPARHGHPWSIEEFGRLIELVESGATDVDIAATLQRSRSGIRSAADRLLPAHLQGNRGQATSKLRDLLPDFDWRSAADDVVTGRTRAAIDQGIEAEVARYLRDRAGIEKRLMEAFAAARAADVDPAYLNRLLDRCCTSAMAPPEVGDEEPIR